MSVSSIKETENAQAFEIIINKPNANTAKPHLSQPPLNPRSPLAERLDNAQRRREIYIHEVLEKAAVKPVKKLSPEPPKSKEAIDEKMQLVEKNRLEKLEKLKEKSQKLIKHDKFSDEAQRDRVHADTTEKVLEQSVQRIKSAEIKRKSLLEEKKNKAACELKKAAEIKQKLDNQAMEKLQQIEQKLSRSSLNHEKHLEKIREKATVKESKETFVEKRQKETVAELDRKMQLVEENKKKNVQLFEQKLKEAEEKRNKVLANAEKRKSFNKSIQ